MLAQFRIYVTIVVEKTQSGQQQNIIGIFKYAQTKPFIITAKVAMFNVIYQNAVSV